MLPMKPASYSALQREDVFPNPFCRDGLHIGSIAALCGLSWARVATRLTIDHPTPLQPVGTRNMLLAPIPPVSERPVDEDTKSRKTVDEEFRGKLLVLTKEHFQHTDFCRPEYSEPVDTRTVLSLQSSVRQFTRFLLIENLNCSRPVAGTPFGVHRVV